MDCRLNHVRLPIGYWAFEVGPGEPYIQGQLPYLTKAITWAENHRLKVIVDLHGNCILTKRYTFLQQNLILAQERQGARMGMSATD